MAAFKMFIMNYINLKNVILSVSDESYDIENKILHVDQDDIYKKIMNYLI